MPSCLSPVTAKIIWTRGGFHSTPRGRVEDGKKLPPSYESPMTPGAERRRGTDAGGTHEGVGPQARRPDVAAERRVGDVRFADHRERLPGHDGIDLR